MAHIAFRTLHLNKANTERLQVINGIIEEYQNDGYILTLRQLYYQLVSRGIIPNKQLEYAKLSTLLKEGRMGGVVDWNAIEDRLRKPDKPASWESPQDIMQVVIDSYELPRQQGQPIYMEVWVEKDALSGVLKRITEPYHIPIMVNRGYSSASAMFDAYQRFQKAYNHSQKIRILYLGDYDPSGIDMIRDVNDRIIEFDEGFYGSPLFDFKVIPIALKREQIIQYNPPPNPAKLTDPRAKDFIKKHGTTSWEVDALPPNVLNDLLTDGIMELLDQNIYEEVLKLEKRGVLQLRNLVKYL